MAKKKESVVDEAKRRFKRSKDFYSDARKRFLEDLKFANADSDNLWQWPQEMINSRKNEDKPCLTINKVRQHNLQITNETKQNKAGVKIRATGGGATSESAEMLRAVVRYIEYHSNAQDAYDTASEFQVQGGCGYWRIVTDWADDESFDQDIFIRRITDPLTVYLDPDAKEKDRSDAKFAFIFEDLTKEDLEARYPEHADKAGETALSFDEGWKSKDEVRVAEYYRVVEDEDTLLMRPDGRLLRKSDVPDSDLWKEFVREPGARQRPIKKPRVEWFFIIGGEVVDERDWPGKYIPIVPLVGEETLIEGKYDCKGHTRALKDPNRMYNYWSSAAVEFGALQSKTPYTAPAAAIEGYENYWSTANRENHSVLPYRHVDDEGNVMEPPKRQDPPVAAPVALSGMEVAQNEMVLASGQPPAKFGEAAPGERSGKMLHERQRQGENATYHFTSNLGVAISHTGRILIDLIPHIYDTERVLQVLAEDGETFELKIDPEQQQTFMERRLHDGEVVERVLNPAVGKYEVQADIGPAFATRRDEAFDAFTQLLTQAPDLTAILGDILFRAADFPLADEAAARLRRMVPREALGLGPTQAEQELQQQVQQLTGTVQALMDELAKEKAASRRQEEKTQIDMYKALTDRLKVLQEQEMSEQEMELAVAQLLKDLLGMDIDVEQREADRSMQSQPGAGEQGELPLSDAPPVEGAQQAPDGNWYVPDPTREGGWMMVQPEDRNA